jgi:hypothetical protein
LRADRRTVDGSVITVTVKYDPAGQSRSASLMGMPMLRHHWAAMIGDHNGAGAGLTYTPEPWEAEHGGSYYERPGDCTTTILEIECR